MIERHQRIENVVNRENYVVIMNGQKPELLRFEPLRLFKCAALWTMPILARLIAEFPALTFWASLQDATKRRRATIQDGAHSFRLLIRKPMSAFVFANVLAKNLSHLVFDPSADIGCSFYKPFSL